MSSLRDIGRVIFGHGWQDPLEWARAVDELADLSDDEIERLVENARQRPVGPDPLRES